MNKLTAFAQILRHLGPAWVLYRLVYALRRRLGALRRSSAAVDWSEVPAPLLRLAEVQGVAALDATWDRRCIEDAEAVLQGEFHLFGHQAAVKTGLPPDWHRNQLTGEQVPAALHWTDLGDFVFGDIKGVWELSRFSWAFLLTRAFARTTDPRYHACFWRLFADWCRSNPPNLGPNWMCGQEATFRLMAVVLTVETMGGNETQRATVAKFAVATARRISANLNYALSQKNNHGVSECVGLITVALWLPAHDESQQWLNRGLCELEQQLSELVYSDGSFSQHSLVYHRVLLHDLAWCAFRLHAAGLAIPEWLAVPANRALAFLIRITDPTNGCAPLFGANDGANILPLADAHFLDMRPVIQLTAAIFHRELPLPAGPWDEAVAWLAGPLASLPRVPWPQCPGLWQAQIGGYAQLSAQRGRLFLRCPSHFRHRPAQADMLHADIWQDGKAIAQDGGSFSYNSTARHTALGDAAQHNAMTVDNIEPLQKFSRFLYLPWPEGHVEAIHDTAIRASHDGYERLGVKWTREVAIRPGGGFFVRDQVETVVRRELRWHWRLADGDWRLQDDALMNTRLPYTIRWRGLAAVHVALIRADETTAFGWTSQLYSETEPALSLVIDSQVAGTAEVLFEFIPAV